MEFVSTYQVWSSSGGDTNLRDDDNAKGQLVPPAEHMVAFSLLGQTHI